MTVSPASDVYTPLPEPIRITEQVWPEGIRPLVSICCTTYNHEQFIAECMNGFLMQETTFPVEVLIHDDASTDNSAQIIREYEARYPALIKAIYQQENQWSKGIRPNPSYNFPRARGRFIAFCEGDDYWSSGAKLQRQVEILDENPQFKLCFHKVTVINEERPRSRKFSFPKDLMERPYSCEELAKKNIIPTCSVLALYDGVTATPDWFYRLPMNDWPRWVMTCKDGYAYGLAEDLGVYRVHRGGIWSCDNRKAQLLGTYDFYCEMEKHGPPCLRTAVAVARREMVIRLLCHEEFGFSKLKTHIFFGPLLRLWQRFVNDAILP